MKAIRGGFRRTVFLNSIIMKPIQAPTKIILTRNKAKRVGGCSKSHTTRVVVTRVDVSFPRALLVYLRLQLNDFRI